MSNPVIHLASASPRRTALLAQLGVAHAVQPVDIDEAVRSGETPADYVCRLSVAKAQALQATLPSNALSLGADTCVALAGEIFGKPSDEDDCLRMLGRLSGRTHCVHTGVTLCHAGHTYTALSTSEVRFRELSRAECQAYWRSGEPRDKAGGYAIQGLGAMFVQHVQGSYTGIVGLPLFETAQLLERAGIEPAALLLGSAP